MLRLVLKTGESLIIEQDGKPIGSIMLKKSGGTRATLLIQLPTSIGVWREAIYKPDRSNVESLIADIADRIEPVDADDIIDSIKSKAVTP